MTNTKKQYLISFSLIGVILLMDQILKIWIKTHLHIGEEIPMIGDWCKIRFIENEGMAFGFSFGGTIGKIALTLFRFIASGAILYYIIYLIKKQKTPMSVIICMSMIVAGALGNLVDSCFYGMIFTDSYYQVATMFPPEGGYAPFLQGKVVDMFYFPIIESTWPQWVPFIGENDFVFFNAIFNIADASISIAVVWMMIYYIFFDKSSSETESCDNVAEEK